MSHYGVILFAFLFFLGQCQAPFSALPERSVTPEPAMPVPSPVVTMTVPPSLTLPAQPTPDVLRLVEPTGLESYRLHITLRFEGRHENTPIQSDTRLTRTVLVDARSQVTQVETRGVEDPFWLLYGQIGEASYFQATPLGRCAVTWGQQVPQDMPLLHPLDLLPGIQSAALVGEEVVDGRPALHYRFEEDGLVGASPSEGGGDVWIAKEGEWLVRYRLHLRGVEGYLGADTTGDLWWTYDVQAINQIEGLPLPSQCPGIPAELPVLPEAEDLVHAPGQVRYRTRLGPDAALQFYRAQAEALGWGDETTLQQSPDSHALVFGGGSEQEILLSLKPVDGLTEVLLQVLDRP